MGVEGLVGEDEGGEEDEESGEMELLSATDEAPNIWLARGHMFCFCGMASNMTACPTRPR